MNTRRDFLKDSLTMAAGSALLPIMSTDHESNHPARITLKEKAVILFQGDSITDSGRNQLIIQANNLQAFGNGYAALVTSQLLFSHPQKKLKLYNRGISGNKIGELAERWKTDCLDLKPDVLSILIGVNDFWRTQDAGYKGTVEEYREGYIKLLKRTRTALPDVQLIIAEPFAVGGVKAVDDKWFPGFEAYQLASRQIADEFNAIFIPLQTVFKLAQKSMPGSFWTTDGVHPTLAGSEVMSKAWLKVFG